MKAFLSDASQLQARPSLLICLNAIMFFLLSVVTPRGDLPKRFSKTTAEVCKKYTSG